MASTANPASGFQPAFKRVHQSNDFDDVFACIATLTGNTVEAVRKVAIDKFKHPAHGPYWIGEELIGKLFKHFGLISTPYSAMTGPISEFPPDVALLMIDYNEETEIGRHVIFHRARINGQKNVEYVIDPAYWITDPNLQVRTDLKALRASWWIGVHQAKPASK